MKLLSRRPLGVALMFATNGISISSVLPWYPTLKAAWGISDFVFGLMVTAIAAGSLAAATLPAWVERTFGARPVMVTGTVLTAVLLAVIGFLPGAGWLALALFVFGIIDAIVDVSQNTAAVRVEIEAGKSIMSSLHACWSLGAVAGSAIATAAAANGMDIRVHLIAVAILQVALVVVAALMMGDVSEHTTASTASAATPVSTDASASAGRDEASRALDAGDADHKESKLSGRVILVALPASIVALSGTIVEDIGNNWAPLSASELTGMALGAAGIAFTAMYFAQIIGRFAGDVLINHFGRVAVARAGGVSIVLGGVCVVAATQPWLLILGYILAGWGCATLVPSAYAAAGQLPGVAQSTGLTVVSWFMRAGFLAASPLIGVVSEATTLRTALLLLPIIGVAVVWAASGLRAQSTAKVIEQEE